MEDVERPSFQPKAAHGNAGSTRDLISFLNDGPPAFEPPAPSASAHHGEVRAKQGRFRSMVTKLTRRSSIEKLAAEQTVSAKRSMSGNHPPPSFVPPPLSAKKSLASISSFSQPPPSATSLSDKSYAPLSLNLSPVKNFGESLPMTPSRNRTSPIAVRKAVPMFDFAPSRTVSVSSTVAPSLAHKDVPPMSQPRESPSPSTPTKAPSRVSPVVDQSPLFTKMTQEKALAASTPSPTSPATSNKPSHINASRTREDEEPRVLPALRPKRTSSVEKAPPSPTWQKLQPPSSKATQRHALTPPATPSSAIFANHARDMRRLMANATNADECRLLVDMFLAQSGCPVRPSDFPLDPVKQPSEQQHAGVVEALLGHDDPSTDSLSTKESTVDIAEALETSLPTPRSMQQRYSPVSSISRKAIPMDMRAFSTTSSSPAPLLAEA